MDVVTRVELEYSYGAGDGRTRSGVASMPKERSGRPRLDQSCDWEKYGYDRNMENTVRLFETRHRCNHFCKWPGFGLKRFGVSTINEPTRAMTRMESPAL